MNLAQAKEKQKREEMRKSKANKKKKGRGKGEILVVTIGPAEEKDSVVVTLHLLNEKNFKETIQKIQEN